MINKALKKGSVVALLIFYLLAVNAIGGEPKSFLIKGVGLTYKGGKLSSASLAGGTIVISRNKSPFLLLYSGPTGAWIALTSLTLTSGDLDVNNKPVGLAVKIDDLNINDALSVIIWTPLSGKPNYYGVTSKTIDSAFMTASDATWDWSGLDLAYKADAPYAPSIVGFEESTTYEEGKDAVSSVKVNAAAGSGSDGLRENSSYSWEMAEEGQALVVVEGATGSTLALDSTKVTAGKTYQFKVGCSNQWGGPTWGVVKTHKVAGGTSSGPVTLTYILKAPVAGKSFGINTLGFSFDNAKGDISGYAVDGNAAVISAKGASNFTLQKLIETINTQATAQRVTSCGYYDKGTATVSAKLSGLLKVGYKADGSIDPAACVATSGDTSTGVLGHVIKLDNTEAYQITINGGADVTFKLLGTQ